MNLTFRLKVNGTEVGKCQYNENTPKDTFIAYIRDTLNLDFDASKDTLEIIREPVTGQTLKPKALDKSQNNKIVDHILSRHVQNLMATYGEELFFQFLADIHNIKKVS